MNCPTSTVKNQFWLMHGAMQNSGRTLFSVLARLPLCALLWSTTVSADEAAVEIPPPAFDMPMVTAGTETAVLAGGCFWGVQGVFQHVKGVSNAVSGYAGGAGYTAHYEVVGSGLSGHAEAVKITYDPRQISYGQLLQIYFSVAHNPTELNRQGPDSGSQYRSTIFVTNAAQQQVATRYIAQLNKATLFPSPIVTTIETGKTFYPAETYHQNFMTLHPTHGYILQNDLPKLANLQRLFGSYYREKPVLVGTR